MRAPLNPPDNYKFLFRLLLTLQGKDALCWSWTTVRNYMWFPACKKWMRDFFAGQPIAAPPVERLRQVQNVVRTRIAPKRRDEIFSFVLQRIRAYVRATPAACG
jgi:hypothetical protein